jgi:cell fate (sporulation/competence/biofilm development) regulator YlbF (YheA/YmcA/DUF963 family)
MNVYDTANKLAKEIKNSTEYIEYKNIKNEIAKNPELKAKVDEFEKTRYELQVFTLNGAEQDNDKVQAMQKEYLELIKIDEVKKYFDLELKFNVLLADINKIIGEAVQDVIVQ